MDGRAGGDDAVEHVEVVLRADDLDGRCLLQHQPQRVRARCALRPVGSGTEAQCAGLIQGVAVAAGRQNAARAVGQQDGVVGTFGVLMNVLDERCGNGDEVLLAAHD